jgi:predicted glycosyltransferase
VRVWVDITAASHVVFFAPIVRRLEEAGHIVTVTARRFADADLLARRYGWGALLTGRHRGGGLGARAVGLVNRTAQLIASASSGRYDVAVGSHASDFVLTCWTLGVPQLTLLDDDRLRGGNLVNVRLVDEVAVPEAMPGAALATLGVPPNKLLRYPGFKEEYYLYDVRPDPDALKRLGIDPDRVVGVIRPPRPARDASGASPAETTLTALVQDLAGQPDVTLVVVARDREQRRRFASLGLAEVLVPSGPVDGIGLIAGADFVLGASGAMPREAVALGTPAYTVSRRSRSAMDAALLAQDRLRRVEVAGISAREEERSR